MAVFNLPEAFGFFEKKFRILFCFLFPDMARNHYKHVTQTRDSKLQSIPELGKNRIIIDDKLTLLNFKHAQA